MARSFNFPSTPVVSTVNNKSLLPGEWNEKILDSSPNKFSRSRAAVHVKPYYFSRKEAFIPPYPILERVRKPGFRSLPLF